VAERVACVFLCEVTRVFCRAMVSGTKLIASELKRKNSKSPAIEDKTKISCSSVLSRRTSTEGEHVLSLGTEVRRGYVNTMKLEHKNRKMTMKLEHKNRKKSLGKKTKIKKLSNSKLSVPEEMSSAIDPTSSHTLLLLDKVSDSVARCK